MVKVSIVVPVYNMEDKLERCLDSLVNQTLSDIEIIIINDGSSDKSLEIIQKYQEKYKNIVAISRENKGISYTRNEGIKLSRGKYIAFVDSDDYVEVDMYEKLYNKIISDNSDIVVCNYKTFIEDSKEFNNYNVNKTNITNLVDNPKLVYLLDYQPWNKLYKKSLWDKVYFPLNTKYEDLEAVLKVFLKAKKVSYISDYLYNYLINPNGETGTINEKVYDIFKILDNLKNEFAKQNQELQESFKELVLSKLFIYYRLIKRKDLKMANEFMKEIKKYLNKNYPHFKFFYLKKSRNVKNFLVRLNDIRIYDIIK